MDQRVLIIDGRDDDVSWRKAADLVKRLEDSGAKVCIIALDRTRPGEYSPPKKFIGIGTFEEIYLREERRNLAKKELDQLNQKLDGLIKQSIPHRFPDEKAAREFIKEDNNHGQNIVIRDEAHFKPPRAFCSIVPRQNPSKAIYVSENGEYSDYAIPKIILNLSNVQQNKQHIIQMNQNRNNNNSSEKSMLDSQIADTTSPRGDLKKKQGTKVIILGGDSPMDRLLSCKSTLSSTDDLMVMRLGSPMPVPHEATKIRQHVNIREEREKTRNALYSRVKQTSESNSILGAQPDSSPILVQQTQTGQGKTAIVKQFWKQASFDATASELIQKSSRLVIGANEFIYDRATFVNQSKVRSALGLIKDIDEFIAKLTGILNSSPVDDKPLPNLSEFPQYAAMAEIRRDLVDAFCSRVAPMYGKPRERANRLISEMPLNYQIELTERINSQL